MFVLAEMKDTVRIKPWLFSLDLQEAIENKLNKKLANKVKQSTTLFVKAWTFRFHTLRP